MSDPEHRSSGYRRRSAVEFLAGAVYLDLAGEERDALFVAGSGRSGTTWLSDLVNADNRFRFIFEPFHPERVDLFAHLQRKPYLRPEVHYPEYYEAVRRVLSGRVRGPWSDRYNRKFLARRRLVKEIRSNLSLGWLRASFPETPLVLLLRHPCAVAASRLRLGWRDDLEDLLAREDLVEDHLLPFERELRAAALTSDPFERTVFSWCIENYVPLKQLAPSEVHVVLYEDLVRDPGGEVQRLFDFLEEGPPPFDSLPRPCLPEGSSSDWTSRVGPERRRRAFEILHLFGLDRLYDEGPTPVGGRTGRAL